MEIECLLLRIITHNSPGLLQPEWEAKAINMVRTSEKEMSPGSSWYSPWLPIAWHRVNPVVSSLAAPSTLTCATFSGSSHFSVLFNDLPLDGSFLGYQRWTYIAPLSSDTGRKSDTYWTLTHQPPMNFQKTGDLVGDRGRHLALKAAENMSKLTRVGWRVTVHLAEHLASVCEALDSFLNRS